ncbi:hypothetical protein QBC37DRAFT_419302 [Rhypophila decipiens]|uniref:Uncharacterized protein n=1 Tax=Rhypophila decipiens TaxID=261697 RepID=A0AAN6YFZ6_9PEZI|nr:hypothetical protein QBC37DRAFT_419302 [Rhypophila decipiens]
MRTACPATLSGRPPRRVIHHLKSKISPQRPILIRPVTHNQPTRILPAHFSRLSFVNSSRLSIPKVSTSSPILLEQSLPVSSPNMPESEPKTPTTTAPEATPATISPNINPAMDSNDNDGDDNTDTSSDGDPIVYQQWDPTIHHFVKQIHLAWSSSPRPLTTATKPQIDEFMTYWRSTFDRLAREIEADTSFPQGLTTPPVSRFDIQLFTQNSGLDCPCCLPIVKPSIILEIEKSEDGAGGGITKGDFLRAIGGYLYGFETLSEASSAQSKVKIRFNGGEFSQTDGGEVTLPTIYSEYELLTRAEYPAYLVKKGDQEWTLQEQLRDRERPLGGWPAGFGGASDRNFDDNPTPRALRERGVDREAVDLVEAMDAKGKEHGTATGPEVESELHGEEKERDVETEEVDNSAEKAKGELETDKSQSEEEVNLVEDQEDEVDDDASSSASAFYEETPNEYKFPAVIWDSSWLSAGGRGPNGERIMFGSTPTVWLFCCPPGDFEDRVGTERFKQKRK